MLEAEIARRASDRSCVESTWKRDVSARQAELRQAEAAADLAERTFAREQELVKTGASTAQRLDESAPRATRRAAPSIAPASCWRAPRRRTAASPWRATSSRCCGSSASWPGAARRAAGDAVEVPHPRPGGADGGADAVHLARRAGAAGHARSSPCSIRATSTCRSTCRSPRSAACASASASRSSSTADPGRRVPGEVSFIADKANFTPEKIETRSDRMGQVYRAKVRILEGVERFQPGTEGNVYLVETEGQGDRRPTAAG